MFGIFKRVKELELQLNEALEGVEEVKAIIKKLSASHCDFCAKSQHDVARIIAGPKVHICNECVGLCMGILREEQR